jgi:hypothetical protein
VTGQRRGYEHGFGNAGLSPRYKGVGIGGPPGPGRGIGGGSSGRDGPSSGSGSGKGGIGESETIGWLLRWPYGSQRRPGAGSSNESLRRSEGAFAQPARYSVIAWRQQMAKHADKGAREALEQAERGKLKDARKIEQAQKSDPDNTEAAEQEASEGPPGRGLAR